MFKIKATDGNAKAGILKTVHGKVQTPFFMPVATKATVKYIDHNQLCQTNTNAIIANAFLLYLNPGVKAITKIGGLHKFMNFNKTIFTDSGGFQILSPDFLMDKSDKGVYFRSPFDGKRHLFTPESSINIQEKLGADIIMAFDDVPNYSKDYNSIAQAVRRTTRWAERCKKAHKNKKQLLFGITQGGIFGDLREKSTREINKLDFDGIAIGGLSIGEPKKQMYSVIKQSIALINKEKPVYLMGVGSPEDLVELVSHGVDIFDSCFPTQNARHNTIFTRKGKVKINKRKYSKDSKPLDANCDCHVCKNLSRAYIHHLVRVKEPSALIYTTFHNIYFIQRLMREMRESILHNEFKNFRKRFKKDFKNYD
jgi:queuine tRNA-ribosyltransferase